MRQLFDQAFIEFDQAIIKKISAGISKMATQSHWQVLESIPEINKPWVHNTQSDPDRIGDVIKVVVFNVERGTRLEPLLIYLREHEVLSGADIILANELDWGMSRSGNRNISATIADALQMNCAFGIEFVSVQAGQNGNQEGLHGNTIFAKNPLEQVKVLRLPIAYEWFESDDPRLGTRIAVFATIQVQGRKVGLVCVHLENRTTPEKRLEQFRMVIDEADACFAGLPVIIGGDMNTNCIDGNDESQVNWLALDKTEQHKRIDQVLDYEPLIRFAAERGYTFESCNVPGQPTRRKHMLDADDIIMNLDWLFVKNLNGKNPVIIQSIFNCSEVRGGDRYPALDGLELSDHDAIAADFEMME